MKLDYILYEKIRTSFLKNPDIFLKKFQDILIVANENIKGEYINQTPVMTSNLRNSVKSTWRKLEGSVRATASYAKYVHAGQGRYKNAADGGYTNTDKNYTQEEIRKFMAMRKRGVQFHIKPNKFADRTFAIVKNTVPEYITNQINKLINS